MRKTLGMMLLLAAAAPAVADDAAKPIAFAADAKVSIDATGKLTKVEASPDLPDAIRAYIEKRVSTWTFAPPQYDGIASAGVTYLHLGACATPAPGGYSLAIDFKGAGPGIPNGQLQPPSYPKEAMRSGIEAKFEATYVVEPDGSATYEKSTYHGPKAHEFEMSAKQWVKAQHFAPEEIDGKPIRSRETISFEFELTTDSIEKLKTKRDVEIGKSNECKMANNSSQDNLTPIAQDSPFKLLNQGS